VHQVGARIDAPVDLVAFAMIQGLGDVRGAVAVHVDLNIRAVLGRQHQQGDVFKHLIGAEVLTHRYFEAQAVIAQGLNLHSTRQHDSWVYRPSGPGDRHGLGAAEFVAAIVANLGRVAR